jgi:hypothetical protein
MRVPQVSERIKEAPAQALRGVFAGIGQLLLITDKLRHKTLGDQDVPRARAPEAAETVTDARVTSPAGSPGETAAEPVAAEPAVAEPAAAAEPVVEPTTAEAPKPPKRQSTRNFDKTGNVRLLADEAASAPAPETAGPEPVAIAEPTVVAGPALVAEPTVVDEPALVAEPTVGAEPGAVPLPNYDTLTVASLRARLRNLDVAQVRQLAAYERTHAGREDVLGMYERRIAKLEAEA